MPGTGTTAVLSTLECRTSLVPVDTLPTDKRGRGAVEGSGGEQSNPLPSPRPPPRAQAGRPLAGRLFTCAPFRLTRCAVQSW
eukprot:359003-Chlamydomonas_euryale.AAC.8